MNILLIRLRLIGDVVLTTPVVKALRRQYPDARITYLVEAAAAPVVEASPHLSQVITIAHDRGWRRIRADLRLGAALRRQRFDLAIDLHGGPRSAWLTWATRAPRRVGYDTAGRSWMYTDVVHRPRAYRPRHAVENQWDLLASLDAAFARSPTRDLDRVEMTVPPAIWTALPNRLAALGVPPSTRLIVMHVSAGNPFRRWPEAAFATLAAGLCAGGPDRSVLVTAGPSDRDAAQRVVAAARDQAGPRAARIVDAETLSLLELRAVLDRAALFVGGDSGPMHVAATSDVPMVTIYGPTRPERSAPWRPAAIPAAAVDAGDLPCRPCDQRVCAPGDFRCLTGVTAEAVRAAAERILERPA